MDVELPWTERYRPKTLSDVVGQKQIVERLQAYAKVKDMMNMMFVGPAGVGKTTCAVALANELYGDEVNRNFLELNASDERGIDIIRGKIKSFAGTLAFGGVPFKIIFLDESDSLTRDAQNALRRTMEKYTRTCRFILSANYSSKILPPIQSRCALFRFNGLKDDEIKEMLNHVSKKEGIEIKEDAFDALIYVSEGDMRKAINILQVASTLDKIVTQEIVYTVASKAQPHEVKAMLELALKGNFLEARKLLYELFYTRALSGEDVLLQVYREVDNLDIDEKQKVVVMDSIGETSFRLTEGSNERIQLEAFLAKLILLNKKT